MNFNHVRCCKKKASATAASVKKNSVCIRYCLYQWASVKAASVKAASVDVASVKATFINAAFQKVASVKGSVP